MTDGQIGTAAAIAASFLAGIVIYAERAFPFLLFAKKLVPHFAALTFTVALHIWKSNALLSIFSGTALYIVLGNVL